MKSHVDGLILNAINWPKWDVDLLGIHEVKHNLVQVRWKEEHGWQDRFMVVSFNRHEIDVRFWAGLSTFSAATGVHTTVLPTDWVAASNFIACIGGSNRGATGSAAGFSGAGSGGGACTVVFNAAFAAGATVTYVVGSAS